MNVNAYKIWPKKYDADEEDCVQVSTVDAVAGDALTAAPRACAVDDEDSGFSVHSCTLASCTTTGFS